VTVARLGWASGQTVAHFQSLLPRQGVTAIGWGPASAGIYSASPTPGWWAPNDIPAHIEPTKSAGQPAPSTRPSLYLEPCATERRERPRARSGLSVMDVYSRPVACNLHENSSDAVCLRLYDDRHVHFCVPLRVGGQVRPMPRPSCRPTGTLSQAPTVR